MKRAMMVAGLGLALGYGMALGAEQIELKPPAGPKLTKAERLAQVKSRIDAAEHLLGQLTPEAIARTEKQSPKTAARDRRAVAAAQAKLPGLKTELAWLEGRLTLAGAESSVKAREADLAKAKPDGPGRGGIDAALAEARRELEQVKKLEESKDF
jgi:hypothetical protein